MRSDDSYEYDPHDLWNTVSDESFLRTEKECQSPISFGSSGIGDNDTTLLYNIEEPSFLNESSVFESASKSILSPMKQVALRRPSTIMEESTIRSINSSDECSDVSSSLSLKQCVKDVTDSTPVFKTKSHSYRPSLINVFPTRTRIGFYDQVDTVTSASTSPAVPVIQRNIIGKENADLISFNNSGACSPKKSTGRSNEMVMENSVNLISFGDSVEEDFSSNVTVDQSQNDSFDEQPPDQFNDTLEAVDFYMMKGKKIMDKTASKSIMEPHVSPSPRNRSNSLLKQTLARRHLMKIIDENQINKKLF